MKQIAALVIVMLCVTTGVSQAETYRVELNASNSAIFFGLDAKQYVTQGYMKYGGSGLYIDNDIKKMGLLNFKLMVGSETLFPDLNCEVGFKGLLGYAEEKNIQKDGSAAAIGFSAVAAYRLPQSISPIPIEFELEFTGAPRPLSFMDINNYFELKTGVNLYIVDNAALQLNYRFYTIDFGDWRFKDDILLLGLLIEF